MNLATDIIPLRLHIVAQMYQDFPRLGITSTELWRRVHPPQLLPSVPHSHHAHIAHRHTAVTQSTATLLSHSLRLHHGHTVHTYHHGHTFHRHTTTRQSSTPPHSTNILRESLKFLCKFTSRSRVIVALKCLWSHESSLTSPTTENESSGKI